MTALLLAARNGHAEAARSLLEAGADVNQPCAGDKSTPLVIAIANGHYDLAKYFVEHGANPNLASIDGLAALYAVEDTEYAEVGWAPNPITAQEKTTYLELLKVLLDHKADPNEQLVKALWFRPTSHNQEWVDKKGITPFWRAAMATDVAAMKILLAGGADPKIASAEGVTPLMVAAGLGWGANASRTVPNGWLPAVQFLVTETGADVNAKDSFIGTALNAAAMCGNADCVRVLLNAGAEVNVNTYIFGYPLESAASAGSLDCVKELLAAGADVNAKGSVIKTSALEMAAETGSSDCVKALIAAGADVNVIDELGYTALSRASAARDKKNAAAFPSIIAILKAAGATE